MKHPAAARRLYWRVSGRGCELRVAMPDDGALTGPLVDDDERNLRRGALDGLGVGRVYPFGDQTRQAKLALGVVTKTSGICASHPEALQADERCRNLAARLFCILQELDLGIETRVFRHAYQMVYSIGPKSDDIKYSALSGISKGNLIAPYRPQRTT